MTKAYPGRKAFFNGISLGGKVVYDFAAKFPDLFLGGAITDVGPGLIEDSALYNFVEVTIPSINLSLPWSELKEEIKAKIPEKNIRIMVQTQVYYPEKDKPAHWKPGIENLQGMLSGTSIKEQWEVLEKLEKGKSRIILLNAEYLSGISQPDLERVRKCSRIEVRRISNSTHFLHITHRKEVERASVDLLET
jgi:pimeloyl-ACP methyl ester carboxylesterase